MLSLFDGMSCGHLALDKVGIEVDTYFASEIDEYVISTTRYNYPQTIQLGSVIDVSEEALNALPKIDLLIGGSPCQNLSSSNVKARDGLKGEKSSLFFEYVRVLNLLKKKNPNIKFLLENVGSASNQDKAIIDDNLGVSGIKFNSQ